MRTPLRRTSAMALACLILGSIATLPAFAATPPGQNLVTYVQQRFGLNDTQARGALGALLVYARDRLPKPDFDDLAERMPNADMAMQSVQQQGVVSGPLDDLEDYEKSLSSLGISQKIAEQIPQAAVEFLGQAGYSRERDILARVIR